MSIIGKPISALQSRRDGPLRLGLKRSVSPLALFAGGVVGVWFDPSDHATSFEDVNGTIPATLPGQPIGLWLDKSKGLVLGPELVANGDFSQGSANWSLGSSWSISNGTAYTDGSITGAVFKQVLANAAVGRLLKVTYEVSDWNGVGTHNALQGDNFGTLLTGNGIFTVFLPQNGDLEVNIQTRSGAAFSVKRVSVRELPGYHATQPVAASRPTLARHPKGGRRNLLNSTNYGDAAWSKQGTTVAGELISTTTADLLTTTVAIPAGVTAITYSERLKRGNHDWVRLTFLNGVNEVRGWFNLATGEVGSQSVTGTGVAAGIDMVADGDGYWRCWIAGSVPGATSLVLGTSSAAADLSFTRVTNSTRFMRDPQVDIGALSPHQKVTSQYDVTEAGVPDCWGLYFDGVDDFMVTPAIDLTGTDKVGVFAGVRKLSDATAGVVAELGGGLDNGSFTLNAAAAPGFFFRSRGSLSAQFNVGTVAAPTTSVVSLIASISSDYLQARLNGVNALSSSDDQGVGNFGNYPLYIGRRGGTTQPAHMILNQLIVAGKGLSAAEIGNNEPYINNKVGAY